jgi:hypothetical protein
MFPKISVRLYVTGESMDPAAVTRTLGLDPSVTWRKGEKRTGIVPAKLDTWAYYVGDSEDVDLTPLLNEMLEVLLPRREAFLDLRRRGELDVELALVAQGGDVAPYFEVEPDSLRAIADLGAHLTLSIS